MGPQPINKMDILWFKDNVATHSWSAPSVAHSTDERLYLKGWTLDDEFQFGNIEFGLFSNQITFFL